MDIRRRKTPQAMIPDTRVREVVIDATLAAAATPIIINDTTCGHTKNSYAIFGYTDGDIRLKNTLYTIRDRGIKGNGVFQ